MSINRLLEEGFVLQLFFKSFFALLSFVFLIILLVLFFAVQTQAKITRKPLIDAVIAKSAEQLLKRTKNSLDQGVYQGNLFIKAVELQGLIAIFNRSYNEIIISARLENKKLITQLSWQLPLNFDFLFLNVKITVLPSSQGLNIENIMIGSLRLSGKLFVSLLQWALNLLQQDLGTQIFQSIKAIDIDQNVLQISYQLPTDFKLFAQQGKGRLIALRDELALFGDASKVRFYFQRLLRFTNQEKPPTKLSNYLAYMLKLAAQQTLINENSSAIKENQSALLALAIYLGAPQFELLVGEISQLSVQEQYHRERLIGRILLAKRNDLQQHYIYSMAIQLFSTINLSHTLGELKELLDSNLGGSGFSFVDLTADRAGARFALLATSSEKSAMQVQAYFSELNTFFARNKKVVETWMFLPILPDISELPEGLSQAEFEQFYRNVNSKIYQKMILFIDSRLAKLPLYQER